MVSVSLLVASSSVTMKKLTAQLFALSGILVVGFFISYSSAFASNAENFAYIKEHSAGHDPNTAYFGWTSHYQKFAIRYIAPDSHAVCSVRLPITQDSGDNSGTFTIKLLQGAVTDSQPQTGAVQLAEFVGDTTDTQLPAFGSIDSSDPLTWPAFNTNSGVCPVLVGNGVYWLVVSYTGTLHANLGDTTLRYMDAVSGDGSTIDYLNESNVSSYEYNGSTWTNTGRLGIYNAWLGITSSSGFPTPGSFASSTSAGCNNGTDISDAICRVGAYLFVPSQDILDQFQNIPTLLGTKIPFIFFDQIITQFGNISLDSASSSPTTSITFGSSTPSTPLAVTGWLPPSLTFMSASSSSPFLTDSTRYLVRAGILIALWFGFAIYIFFEIRNLLRV